MLYDEWLLNNGTSFKTESYPITGLNRLLGLWEVEASRIFRLSAHEGGTLSALRTEGFYP